MFYFLKLNEPVYAFHLLKMAETTLRTVIYPLSGTMKLTQNEIFEALPVMAGYKIETRPPETFIDFIKEETSVEF